MEQHQNYKSSADISPSEAVDLLERIKNEISHSVRYGYCREISGEGTLSYRYPDQFGGEFVISITENGQGSLIQEINVRDRAQRIYKKYEVTFSGKEIDLFCAEFRKLIGEDYQPFSDLKLEADFGEALELFKLEIDEAVRSSYIVEWFDEAQLTRRGDTRPLSERDLCFALITVSADLIVSKQPGDDFKLELSFNQGEKRLPLVAEGVAEYAEKILEELVKWIYPFEHLCRPEDESVSSSGMRACALKFGVKEFITDPELQKRQEERDKKLEQEMQARSAARVNALSFLRFSRDHDLLSQRRRRRGRGL